MRFNFMLFGCLFGLCVMPTTKTPADLVVHNSATPSLNSTTRAAWLASIGISAPAFTENFESGFTDNQNISGQSGLFAGGLIVTDTGPGVAEAVIRTGAGTVGGSNPVGDFSLTHDEQRYLEFDFSTNPVDYFGFHDIDHTGTNVIVSYVGGGTTSFSLDSTGGTGNSAEFAGIFRNDLTRISRIQFDASGDGRWGMDTFEYGFSVPEPSAFFLLAMIIGLCGMSRRQSRRLVPTQ